MIILGIETTCDETGASLVRDGQEILSHSIASSAEIHERYGGVFPELACRRHIDAILPVIQEAMVAPVDAIAVAKGPGLVGALLIGMQVAKGLKIAWEKPLIGVNHVEAHLYAAFMELPATSWLFPSLGIVLSGGHTFLVRIDAIGSYQLLGTTVDDAIGEAFDKVGTLLGLTYPGGPKVELLAREGDPKRFPFQAGKVKINPLAFSFSGLKTSLLYAVRGKTLGEQEKKDLAASFQETAFSDVASKAALAMKDFPCKAIYFGGGVTCNQRLRALFKERFPSHPLFFPPLHLTLDNAAMIGGLGYHLLLNKPEGDPLTLNVHPRIDLTNLRL